MRREGENSILSNRGISNSHILKLLNWQLKLLTIPKNPLVRLVKGKQLNNEGKEEVGIEKVDILTIIPKKDVVNEMVDSYQSIKKVEEGVSKADTIDKIGSNNSNVEILCVPDGFRVKEKVREGERGWDKDRQDHDLSLTHSSVGLCRKYGSTHCQIKLYK